MELYGVSLGMTAKTKIDADLQLDPFGTMTPRQYDVFNVDMYSRLLSRDSMFAHA
jgi:hypothetical protein